MEDVVLPLQSDERTDEKKICLNMKLDSKKLTLSDGIGQCKAILQSSQGILLSKCGDIKCRPLNINIDSEIKEIGRGSFNVVYEIDDNVVLRLNKSGIDKKQLTEEMDGLYIQTLLSKDKKSGGFGCKYICKVIDFGYLEPTGDIEEFIGTFGSDKGAYAFLEKMDGELFDEINKAKSYSEDECKEVVKNILFGLECIHKNGYAHLDLKLENVMLTSESKTDARLIDFGFTKKIGNNAYERVIQFDRPFGTKGYVSPEMYKESKGNGKSDIWALAIMIIEMLRIDISLSVLYGDLKKRWYDWDTYRGMVFNEKQFKEHINILRFQYRNGNLFYNEKTKEKYSEQFRDFLFRLLTYEHKDRPTATECLNHEWITGNPLTAAYEFAEEQSKIIERETKAYNEALDAADAYATEQEERKRHGSTARVLEFPPVHVEPVHGGSKKTNRKRSKGKKRSTKK